MKQKVTLFISILLLFITAANAQIENPVKWSYAAKKLADKTYELHIAANIDRNWHIYAQDAGRGPQPTTISFKTNPLISFNGTVKEIGKLEKINEKKFNWVSKYYGKKVDFVQKIKVRSSVATVVSGTINYVACDSRQCLPPKDIPFTINIGGE